MPDHVEIPAVPHISSFFIGRRIRKLRIRNDLSRKWYTGTITAWDPDDKMYHAKYDDNDSEDLDHKEMFECINTFEKYWQQKRNDKEKKRLRRAQVRGLGSWVLGLGSWVLGLGSWVFGLRSSVFGLRSWVVGRGSWVFGLQSSVFGLGSWVLGRGSWVLGLGS